MVHVDRQRVAAEAEQEVRRIASIHQVAWSTIGMVIALVATALVAYSIYQWVTPGAQSRCRSGVLKVYSSVKETRDTYTDGDPISGRTITPTMLLCKDGTLVRP